MINLQKFNHILLTLFIFSACQFSTEEERLPVLGHKKIEEKTVNGNIVPDTVYHTIPAFRFVDQDSTWVDNGTFDNKIYIADFFFTSCPDICPAMKTQMLRIYEKYKDNNQVAFLSHTIDPKRDSVAVLKEYSERIGVDKPEKWHFVTGNKDDIYDIALNGYIVTADENTDAPGGFIHSGAFILVDMQGRIRGLYDGTVPEKVDLLIDDIPILLAEYEKK